MSKSKEDLKEFEDFLYNPKHPDRLMLTVLRQSIKNICENCLERGYATQGEIRQLDWDFYSYKRLYRDSVKNSIAEVLFEKTKRLPIK